MRRELEKYGIQMPAFSKIGGILANEVRKYSQFVDENFNSFAISETISIF